MKRWKKIGDLAGVLLIIVCILFVRFAVSEIQKIRARVTVQKLRVCHLDNPLGIDEEIPVFSWQMESNRRGSRQEAYRITVAQGESALRQKEYVWDSGKIESGNSVGIPYEGEALEAKSKYYWQVEIWDEQGEAYHSAENAWFETGLMGEGMADACWISAEKKSHDQTFSAEELSYSISYEMEIEGTTAGLVFGAQEGRYGRAYLCQIKNSGEQAWFRLVEMNGSISEEGEEREITDFLPGDGKSFSVELSIEKEELGVKINGAEIRNFQIRETPMGSIGYYKSRGGSYGWLDNLLVMDQSGAVIYEEDFEGEGTIFDPYYVAVEDGRLKIGSGMVLTPGKDTPAPMFRREFSVSDKEISSARIYMTALGSFALSVNGQRVSEDYFSPGKLAYNQQLSYMTYDVTELLKQGQDNAFGVILLHGWYDRGVGYPEIWNPWGDTNALLGKLEIIYEDGSIDEIVTNEDFQCFTDGPVRDEDLYQGEFYDANFEQDGFDTVDFKSEDFKPEDWEAAGWEPAKENQVKEEYLTLPLIGKINESIACMETLSPISVSEPVENVFVYDFGQNFTGICRIKVTGEKGQVVILRHGEALNSEDLLNKDDQAGTIWTENLLTAEATDYYVLKGDEQGEVFEPEFVFHGFRYLQISGLDEALPVEDVEGLVLSSDLEQTGSFSCSDELLNQYYQNTLWSQKGNFLDNPMDCPQRDERHGWAGDAQVFSLAASYNMDTFAFYRKFLQEERSIQNEGGSFADMVPRNFGTRWDGSGGAASNNCWGDAPVVITWNLYMQYGDKSIVEENYDALCRWVDLLVDSSEDYIRYQGGYGDHMSSEDTPKEVSDTAWCARSADLVSRMADLLGRTEDAEHYRQVYESFKLAWQRQFVGADGQTVCDTQTSYALGLQFSLFPEELKDAAAARLALLAEYSGYHVNTGFSGIGYLLPALGNNGYMDSAYRMLLQKECPSLLFPSTKGATTNWEKLWSYTEQENGYLIDGSLNHFAFGAPVSWLYTDVLGIKSDEKEPGFKHILLEPKPGGGLTYAEGSYTGAYGKIGVKWEQTEKGYRYFFEIPANTTATLSLPAGIYREDGKEITKVKGITFLEDHGETVKYELLAGTYEITQE